MNVESRLTRSPGSRHATWIYTLVSCCVLGCTQPESSPTFLPQIQSEHPIQITSDTDHVDEHVIPKIRETPLSVQPVWKIEGLGAPASIAFDPTQNELRMVQIGGDGAAKDGDGVVSRLSLNGEMLDFAWCKGLNAPKDLMIKDDLLLVTDIDVVHEIDRQLGNVRRTIPIPGARFLVGIASENSESILLTDLLASCIMRLQDDKVHLVQQGRELDSPAKIRADSKRIVIAPWGYTTDFSGEASGKIFDWDSDTGSTSPWAIPLSGHWMGISPDGNGGMFLGDFETGNIIRTTRNGNCELICVLGRGLGGILYLPETKLLFATHITENKLFAFYLSESVARRQEPQAAQINVF